VRRTALAVALLLAGPDPPAAHAADRSERPRRTAEARPARLAEEPVVIGLIRYDTGVNVGFHPDSISGSLNRVVGNRFNSAFGGPLLMSNRVFSLTVFPAESGFQSLSIATGPTSMGTAMVLDFLAVNLMANQFNTIPLSPSVATGPEFLGLFLGRFGAHQPAGLVGMSDMGTQGQGFHAVQAYYRGTIMLVTNIQPVPSRNAMVRARIDVFPVELMEFRLE
jgi:hypothetical protein